MEKEGREAEAQEVQMFDEVLKLNETVIFADAKYHICKSMQERLRLLSRIPQDEDVRTLRKYTFDVIQGLSDPYLHFTKSDFVQLRTGVCSRLTSFNARRGGEPSRLKMSQWTDRKKWTDK